MLVLAACALALISPLLAARWPAALLLHRWCWPLLIWVTLAIQVVVVEVPLPGGLAPVLHVMTYLVALGFVWANRHIPRIMLVAAGAAANGITIALNNGVLPASAGAVASAGIDPHTAFANSAIIDHPTLPWLGDVFAWPAPLPLANTFSVGDVLIVLGILLAAWTGTRQLDWHLPRRSNGKIHDDSDTSTNHRPMPGPPAPHARGQEGARQS